MRNGKRSACFFQWDDICPLSLNIMNGNSCVLSHCCLNVLARGKKKVETKIWMYSYCFSSLSCVYYGRYVFALHTVFIRRPPNFCLDSLFLTPQACKAKSPYYKADWPILFRSCPKLKDPKRDAWLTSYLRFFLTKGTSCVFASTAPWNS